MPIIEINLAEGRSTDMKQRLYREVTEAAMRSLNVPAEQVRIILREIPVENFAVGGQVKFAPVPKSMLEGGQAAETGLANGGNCESGDSFQ